MLDARTPLYQSTYSRMLRLIVRTVTQLIGRGAGKIAPLLPPGQTDQVQGYCNEFQFNVDTTYPIESTIWLSGIDDRQTTQFLKTVLRPDDVFLDIGANCGALTLVARPSTDLF
jgi:hypothetical protein